MFTLSYITYDARIHEMKHNLVASFSSVLVYGILTGSTLANFDIIVFVQFGISLILWIFQICIKRTRLIHSSNT